MVLTKLAVEDPGPPGGHDLLGTLVGGRRVVCVVGAGGKKSIMYALAAASRGRIALSSTSHMYPYDRSCIDAVVTVAAGALPPVAPGLRTVAFAAETATPGRIGGLSMDQIAALARDASFDLLLIKADGARARLVKAPAEYEPVIPASCERVIYVVSARAMGRPLDERIAHRPERIAVVAGTRVGQVLDALHVGRLLSSGEAALKGVGTADVIPVINMVDDAWLLERSRVAAREALARTSRFDAVVLAHMKSSRIVEIVRRSTRSRLLDGNA